MNVHDRIVFTAAAALVALISGALVAAGDIAMAVGAAIAGLVGLAVAWGIVNTFPHPTQAWRIVTEHGRTAMLLVREDDRCVVCGCISNDVQPVGDAPVCHTCAAEIAALWREGVWE